MPKKQKKSPSKSLSYNKQMLQSALLFSFCVISSQNRHVAFTYLPRFCYRRKTEKDKKKSETPPWTPQLSPPSAGKESHLCQHQWSLNLMKNTVIACGVGVKICDF